MDAPGLTDVTVSTTWNKAATFATDLDLDLSALSLTGQGTVPSDAEFVFFNNSESPSRAVLHRADPGGVLETLGIALSATPSTVAEIALVATLYDEKGTFGLLRDATVTVSDRQLGTLAEFSLSESLGEHTAVHYGSLYRDGDRWLFRAVADTYPGLAAVARKFGVDV
ncbi:MAG: TerD family protein [Gordonia sp. (in: high G+C Gram-positive bacteria)]|uniref:TerD family protein n=1 Tax=Gordonia sp. (in: high G+C Gram-positive bacteria) TaxID=84139 RepID=UPI0039E45B72